MANEERILKKCYFVKCPLFGEDGKLRPGQYNNVVFLIPNPSNSEQAAAEEKEAAQFFTGAPYNFSNSSSGARRMLQADTDTYKLNLIREEDPELAEMPNNVIGFSLQAAELNPAVYKVWHITPENAARFEKMGFDRKCAAIIAPSSEEMHNYLDALEQKNIAAKLQWIKRFGNVSSVDLDTFANKMTFEEQYANPFLVDDMEKVWMHPPWMVANDLANEHKMYEAVKALSEKISCPFTYKTASIVKSR